jgi:hypothetical protein
MKIMPVKLYLQTQILGIAYTVLLLSLFLRKDFTNNQRIYIFISLLISALPMMYTIQCLISGKCEMWAWYHVGIISLWCLMVSFLSTACSMNIISCVHK